MVFKKMCFSQSWCLWNNRTNQPLFVRPKLTHSRGKSMILAKELNNGNIGYFWMWAVPTEMSQFAATNGVCVRHFFQLESTPTRSLTFRYLISCSFIYRHFIRIIGQIDPFSTDWNWPEIWSKQVRFLSVPIPNWICRSSEFRRHQS